MSIARQGIAALAVISVTILLCVGCSDDGGAPVDSRPDQPPDAAGDAADLAPDLPPPDSAVDEGPEADAAPVTCNESLDLVPLALDASYCVVHRFPLARTPAAFNITGSSQLWTYFFELAQGTYTAEIIVSTIDSVQGRPSGISMAFSFTEAAPPALFASNYLALSPGGFAAVGYTQETTFEGDIVWGDKGIAEPNTIAGATGNFDAVFLDDTTLLVNGIALGAAQSGQGVYLHVEGQAPRQLITGLGVASGPLELGQDVLFAGGYDSTDGTRVFGFSLAEVQQAISSGTTLSATVDGDLISTGSMMAAAAVGNDLVVATLDLTFAFGGVKRFPVTITADAVSAAAAVDLVAASADGAVTHLDGWGERIGLLLESPLGPEIAVIQPL